MTNHRSSTTRYTYQQQDVVIPKNNDRVSSKSTGRPRNTGLDSNSEYIQQPYFEREVVKSSSKIRTNTQTSPSPTYLISNGNTSNNKLVKDEDTLNQFIPDLVEHLVEKAVKSIKSELDNSNNTGVLMVMNAQAEYQKQIIEKMEEGLQKQSDLLEILLGDKLTLSNLISRASIEQLDQIQQVKSENLEEIRNLKQSNIIEFKLLDNKLSQIQKSIEDVHSEMKNMNSKIEGLHTMYNQLKFKGNQPSKVSSMFNSFFGGGKDTKTVVNEEPKTIVPSTSQSLYSTISFSVFPNTGYEKATDQLINTIRNQCDSNQIYINYQTKNKIEDYESGEKVLFIRYCGSTRFESPDASALLEKGCKIVFILFTYGDKTKEIRLPSQFQNCPYMQVPISGIYLHNTQDLVGMDDQRGGQLFQIISNQFIDQ